LSASILERHGKDQRYHQKVSVPHVADPVFERAGVQEKWGRGVHD
jgi:hypothetical protein